MTAATGRPDYDGAIHLTTLAPGEPFFIIRASDAVAGDAVRAWAGFAHAQGTPPAALELALQQADRLDAWPTKKAPDGPRLDDTSRKQLEYQFSRRAWAARSTFAGTDLLAVQLGKDDVLGRLRPIVSELSAAAMAGGDIKPALRSLCALVGRDFDTFLAAGKPAADREGAA